MKVFVPFSETLVDQLGLNLGDLVPFKLEYQCLRVGDMFPAEEEGARLEADALSD